MEGRAPRALHVRRMMFLGLKDIIEIHVAQSISLLLAVDTQDISILSGVTSQWLSDIAEIHVAQPISLAGSIS